MDSSASPPAPTATPAPAEDLAKSADERKSSLDRTLADRGAQGWRIENRSYFQATFASGNRINHVLHLILTIVTAGLWGIVWIIFAITGGIKRHLITVDEYGNVVERKIQAFGSPPGPPYAALRTAEHRHVPAALGASVTRRQGGCALARSSRSTS